MTLSTTFPESGTPNPGIGMTEMQRSMAMLDGGEPAVELPASAPASTDDALANPALVPGVTIGENGAAALAKNYFLLTCNGEKRLVNAATLAVAQRFVRPEVEVSVASTEDVLALYVPGLEVERAGEFEGRGKLYVAKTGDRAVLVRSASAAAVKALKSYEVTGESLGAEEMLEALDAGMKVEIAPLPKTRAKKDGSDTQADAT